VQSLGNVQKMLCHSGAPQVGSWKHGLFLRGNYIYISEVSEDKEVLRRMMSVSCLGHYITRNGTCSSGGEITEFW
jgi:hypothetical protein